jgi:hypothetical protein
MLDSGGTLAGIPVLRSAYAPSGQVTLLDANELLLSDSGVIELSVSRAAALQMDDAPSEGAQQLVSLFQANVTALKIVRYVSWSMANADAVAVLTSVAW